MPCSSSGIDLYFFCLQELIFFRAASFLYIFKSSLCFLEGQSKASVNEDICRPKSICVPRGYGSPYRTIDYWCWTSHCDLSWGAAWPWGTQEGSFALWKQSLEKPNYIDPGEGEDLKALARIWAARLVMILAQPSPVDSFFRVVKTIWRKIHCLKCVTTFHFLFYGCFSWLSNTNKTLVWLEMTTGATS